MYVNVTVLRGNSRSEEESMHPERQIEWDASWNHSSAAQNHHSTGLKYWETINGTTFFLNLVAILCGIVWEWDPPKFFMVQNHSTGHNWRCITYILYWCVCVFHVFSSKSPWWLYILPAQSPWSLGNAICTYKKTTSIDMFRGRFHKRGYLLVSSLLGLVGIGMLGFFEQGRSGPGAFPWAMRTWGTLW